MNTSSDSNFDIQAFLAQLTEKPGVYRMLDSEHQVIYVGKAKNLKKRVSSYFNKTDLSIKTQVMVKQVREIEFTVTNTETEALLLENNYIKQIKPRYNVIFRDDKSYPYVFLSKGDFPRLAYHRGAKKAKGDYFGPFPSSGAVKQSLTLLQKLFRVRQCEDSVFQNRSRPCLQYQIKRCTAPCVNYISKEEYAKDVKLTRLFYQGKDEQVIDELKGRMEEASNQLEFESAAYYRDLISSMRKVVEKQVISGSEVNADVFSVALKAGVACVTAVFIRQGKVLGTKSFFPKVTSINSLKELTESFIVQFYLSSREVPAEVILGECDVDIDVLSAAVREIAGRQVRVSNNVRSDRASWVKLANQNCEQALMSRLNSQTNQTKKLQALQKDLNLPSAPNHMECFDISHTMGEGTVASCVVFKEGAPDRKSYRRFNIVDVTPGDDYAAIEQAVSRRYARLLKEEASMPDLILIDGGKGQLKSAQKAFDELGLSDSCLISVAKGTERKAGMEQLFKPGNSIAQVLPDSSASLHLIQHIRDEAHRFAIAGHRAKRGKTRVKSWLEEIPGVGAKKRQELLKHFGGLQNIESAALEDLKKVRGINTHLAEKIYNHIHEK
ncbi:excinuclease ABC subunit UvrC [Pleionea sediminis]|uniref:excinuclease ABC subunit UvrC n=1 Tax=Pleionea sediminis TaxID=2569479 RepID=UPI0011862DE1|nr:excinuclease ABC subunit UvrC [Pleionea sediminis]